MKIQDEYLVLFAEQLDKWNCRIDAQILDLKNRSDTVDERAKIKCSKLIEELNLKKIFLDDRMEELRGLIQNVQTDLRSEIEMTWIILKKTINQTIFDDD